MDNCNLKYIIFIYYYIMKNVTIKIGDDDLTDLANIFKNESSFKPMTKEDNLIIQILKQVLNNPKNDIVEVEIINS